eukprot:CAMPEP_0177728050 /NCGR_PEP_ID=MMETSP0484_2-20121128/20668_1 /TAXON_ID=354590 /ORGANISM="Rhodomonas lens, Strain RHODO" /LENGTH=197 /DNA_ID=CAMNT_0019240785 /DNA_START=13 /DNA_END=604 /DNA_ORIENTATION=+
MAAHSVAVVILVLCVLPGAMSWSLPAATRLPSLRRQPGHAIDLCMQASNAEQALARLQQQKQAKISLSKFESYTVRLKKPMGLVFEENAVATKGVFVAAVNKEATNPGNFEGWGFDQITLRDQLLRVDDMQGKVSDARCLDFDRAIALIAESPSMEMELTFAATGGAIDTQGRIPQSEQWISDWPEPESHSGRIESV